MYPLASAPISTPESFIRPGLPIRTTEPGAGLRLGVQKDTPLPGSATKSDTGTRHSFSAAACASARAWEREVGAGGGAWRGPVEASRPVGPVGLVAPVSDAEVRLAWPGVAPEAPDLEGR